MKIAVLGGSFNPIHIGHLALADEVCSSLGYDKILFVPTYNPPHKELNEFVDPYVRLEMVRLACSSDERFEAEGCEIERKGISYTYDTICYLEEKYKGVLDGKIGFIMGDDLLAGFHLWHRAEELSRKCQLILARRPFGEENSSHKNKAKGQYDSINRKCFDLTQEALFEASLKVDNPSLTISSTDIRYRISSGRSFKYLVSAEVFKYIKDKGLYGSVEC